MLGSEIHELAARPVARSRTQSYPDALPLALGAVSILAFVALSVWRLDTLPPVYEDEPWQASTASKLASQGVFGSDVFAGWNGMEQHYYGFLPVHPLLMAAVFKVFGEGLLQARLEVVFASSVSLCLTLLLARRLFSAWVGAIALILLLLVRWTGTTTIQVTGIPFVDLARIARYDAVVPVFALASLLAYTGGPVRGIWHGASRRRGLRPAQTGGILRQVWHGAWRRRGLRPAQTGGILRQVWHGASRRRGRSPLSSPVPGLAAADLGWRYALAGLMAGLAGLTHVYGLFWLIVLALLAIWDRKGPRAVFWLAAGAALPWLPYLAYVLSDVPGWRAQVAGYADRFGLLDPRFYLSNLVDEPHRYGPGLGPPGVSWLLRPGFWSLLVLVPASLIALVRQAVRQHDPAARAIVVPAILLPVLFALLLRLKLVNYTLTFQPVLAIAAAWGILQALRWLPARPLGGLLALAVVVEGVSRLALLETTPATPYATFIAQVHRTIPAGARVVGLHNYWFGFEDTDYRSLVVPLAWMDPGGLPLDQGLDRLAPDALLLDDRMRTYLSYDPRARAGFEAWLTASEARLVDQVDDPTYGLMQIYMPRASAYTGPAIREHGGKL